MLTRASNQFNIRYSHSVLHRIPLYYEKPKESSINIKKMNFTGKLADINFYFKNIFQFENQNPFPGGAQWVA